MRSTEIVDIFLLNPDHEKYLAHSHRQSFFISLEPGSQSLTTSLLQLKSIRSLHNWQARYRTDIASRPKLSRSHLKIIFNLISSQKSNTSTNGKTLVATQQVLSFNNQELILTSQILLFSEPNSLTPFQLFQSHQHHSTCGKNSQ